MADFFVNMLNMQTHSNFFHLCDVGATSESLFVVVKKSERTRLFCVQDYLLTMKDVRTCKLQAKVVVCTSLKLQKKKKKKILLFS